MGYIALFILVFFCIIFPKNRIVRFLLIFYLWAMVGLNSLTPDYYSYKFWYENPIIMASYEPGYNLLNLLCGSLSLSYEMFRCVVALISLIILIRAIKIFSLDYENLIWGLIAIYPFFCFSSALRSAISFSLSILGFSFLLRSARKIEELYFVISIILATLFHYSYIIFLPLLIIKKLPSGVTFIIVFFCEILFFFLYRLNLLYNFASYFISSDKVLGWLFYDKGRSSPSFFTCVMLSVIFLSLIIYLWILFNLNVISRDYKMKKIIIFNKLLLLNLFLIPLTYIDVAFVRLFSISIVVNTIILLKGKKQITFFYLIFPYVILMILTGFVIDGKIYIQIMENNLLWG